MQSTTEIFNRPPSIAEDALHYALYPQDASSDKTNISALALAIQAFLDETLRGFIWHRDSFELKLLQDEDTKLYYIGGDMRVGDSIDDEWCAVWLLKEISARWDVAVSVYDSDGDFLLIEAADALPSWVTPTVSENRVWIYAAQLHLIPLQHVSPPHTVRRKRRIYAGDDELAGVDVGTNPEAAGEWLAVPDALKLVRNSAVATRAPRAVEETVWKRISAYPAALASHMHTTKAFIPMDVAKALASNPDLVQKAVETFYTRDPAQLRAAHKMSRFPPSRSVLRRVRMTRTAYAQLLGQKFYPPKIFGTFREAEGSPTWRWRDVGMKIACGFEMLYQESKSRSESTADALRSAVDARKDALRRDNEYIAYIKTLLFAGYFGSEMEGSAKWSELEDKAVDVFVRTRQQDSTSTRPSFATQVNTSISNAPSSLTDELNAPEDPDDWLNVDATDFDSFLAEKMNLTTKPKPQTDAMDVDKKEDDGEMSDGEVKAAEDMLAKEQAARLQDLAKKVEKFLGAKGDVEGARFEDEKSDDEDALSEFSDEQFSDDDSEEEGPAEEVETEESRAARREAMDKLVPALSAGEYGQMPAAYHANSQRVTRATVNTDTIGGLPTSPSSSNTNPRPVRGPILMRDRYEGVDSDDETDEEDEDEAGAESDEENQPQVVGDVEVDMGEEEDDFLEFSRQALGIDDQQWKDIISERKARGAFVPTHVVTESKAKTSGGKKDAKEPQLRTPAPGPRPNANPNLDSFEAVMQAMETELARSRAAKEPFKAPNPNFKTTSSSNPAPSDAKGKAKAEDDDMDIEAAMEEELRAALGEEDDLDDDVEVDEDGLPINGEGGLDYNLIKNFLESFKSQGGLAGPVSSLAGRLQPGWNMPRDDA